MAFSDFDRALTELTPLSPEEVRKLHLLFDGDDPAGRQQALDALLQKAGKLPPLAVAQLRRSLLDPDAAVRWMSIQILARADAPPLQLLASLLGDDSPVVRDAAEQALVAAGHPAIAPLAKVVAAEPCYSVAKVAATRALGALGDECGIEAVAVALIRNPTGCYDHETAFRALRKMGPSAIETLVVLLKHRLLMGEAYLALLEYDPAALKSALLAVIDDPDREIDDRLHFAKQAEVLLGTRAILGELEAFYLGVAGDPSMPPEIVETARSAWAARPRGSFIVAALTRERAESDFDAQRFIEQDEALERERRWKADVERALASPAPPPPPQWAAPSRSRVFSSGAG